MNAQFAIAVAAGGALGSLLRYFVSHTASLYTSLPAGTLISNVASCIMLTSATLWLAAKPDAAPWVRFFLIAGICGGFSTFSTFSLETVQLLKDGLMVHAIANIAFNLFICLGICYYFIKN